MNILPLLCLAASSVLHSAHANRSSLDPPAVQEVIPLAPSPAPISPQPVANQPSNTVRPTAPSFNQRYRRELLALIGLLALLLVTRLFTPPEKGKSRLTKRHSPLNADEFARVIFSIVRGENVPEYRGLYISGPEAVAVMGESTARSYLKTRSPEIFEMAFDELFDRVPANARFERGHINDENAVALWVVDPQHNRHRIPIGHIARVGAIVRLVSPIVGDNAKPHLEYIGEPNTDS